MPRKAIQFKLTKDIYKALLSQYAWATKIVYKKHSAIVVNLNVSQLLIHDKPKPWNQTYHVIPEHAHQYRLLNEDDVLTLILLASANDVDLLQHTATQMYKQLGKTNFNAISNS